MIIDLTKTILYFCPSCPTLSFKHISAFDLKKEKRLRLRCTGKGCNEEIAELTYSRGKYKISVNCPICGDYHSFTLSKKNIWDKDISVLQCPESGMGILYIGNNKEKLLEEYNSNNMSFSGDFSPHEDDIPILNNPMDIAYTIVEHINQFAKANKVDCSCGNRDIGIAVNLDNVTLTCRACKKRMVLEATPQTMYFLSLVGGLRISD